jgi:rRNA processing protein Gar1
MIQALHILKQHMQIKLHSSEKDLTPKQIQKAKEKIGYVSMAISHIDELYDRLSWWEKKCQRLEMKYLIKAQQNLKLKREIKRLSTDLDQMKELFLNQEQ